MAGDILQKKERINTMNIKTLGRVTNHWP